jgi:hypothetical protein
MTTYITQEQAVAIAKEAGALIENWQPKPASVEANYDEVICPKCVHQFGAIPVNVQTKLTQQAEALAQALAEIERLNKQDLQQVMALASKSAEVRNLRAQLAALQYDGELPEPVGYQYQNTITGAWCNFTDKSHYEANAHVTTLTLREIYTADQVRQAIAKAKQVPPEWATFLHYPDCWDTAAYPTLHDAIHEALAWSGCSVCKPAAPSPKDSL